MTSSPGFNNIVLSTQDGGRQSGVMMNVEAAPPKCPRAFGQTIMAIAIGLLDGVA